MVWSRSLPKSNPVGRTRAEQAAGAARFATGCPPVLGGKKHAWHRKNRLLFAPAKIRPTWIRHAANLQVLLWCRADTSRPPTEHNDSLQRLFPPPKTHTSIAATRARGFPNHGPFSFYTPGGPSMAPAGFRGCGASQGCPEPRAVAPPGDRDAGQWPASWATSEYELRRRGITPTVEPAYVTSEAMDGAAQAHPSEWRPGGPQRTSGETVRGNPSPARRLP